MATKSYDALLNEVENKRKAFATANQMLAANDAQRVQTRYDKDRQAGVAVQSAEVARVLKGESGIDGLLKRFASASGLSRKELYGMSKQYDGSDVTGGMVNFNVKQDDTSVDLLVGVNLYDTKSPSTGVRVGYNVVDLLDNIYNQIKKKHRIPALPTFGNLVGTNENYLGLNDTDPTASTSTYDANTSKLLSSSNVKDVRDFTKKALLPYVTAFFRAFELSDEMIHAAIDAKKDVNTKNPLTTKVVPIDTSAGIMVRMGRPELYEAMKLVALGSPMISDTLDVFKMAVSRASPYTGGQEGGKKKRSSKKRSSGRKMRGGDDQEVQPMEGGKKKRSSKKRSSSKKHGGAKKRSSKKRSSSRKMRGGQEAQQGMEGGKKKRSSKKRSSSKRHGGAKRRSSKKRASGRKH
jgi:hypothetical protein